MTAPSSPTSPSPSGRVVDGALVGEGRTEALRGVVACELCGTIEPPWEVTGILQPSPDDHAVTVDSWACDDDLADVARLIQQRIGYSTVVVVEHG